MQLDLLREYFSVSGTFDPGQTFIYSLILIALSSLVAITYYYLGNSLSSRSRLAVILPLMSLTTMLIISIIQSSLALSLGLVGALSIVRFRSAIKDPEELAYIFLTIALGLGFGANQPIITLIFFGVIMAVILGQALLRRQLSRLFTDKDSLHLEIVFAQPQPLPEVLKVLESHCHQIKLIRLSQEKEQVMMFLVKPKSNTDLEKLRQTLTKMDKTVRLTLLQYQPLV